MSRRRDEQPIAEVPHAKTRPPEQPAVRAPDPVVTVDQPPQVFLNRPEWLEAMTFATVEDYRVMERKMLDLYRLNPGKCPRCGVRSRGGIIGHISKCLRTSKFKIESTPTT